MFEIMSNAVFPLYTSLLVSRDITSSRPEEMLSRKLFASGNESNLLRCILEREITRKDFHYIVLHICHLLLKIFNNVTESSYSYNVQQLIQKKLTNLQGYFFSGMCRNNDIIPVEKDSEIIKILVNFAILPETSIILEFPKYIT
jgi:hypothetical protein